MSFLEFLAENNLSHSPIANYLSAVKANLALYGLPLYSFQDPRIMYFQKSLSVHKTFAPVVKKIIDIPLLASITSICDTMWMGQIFKALYLTAFFSFLRISNLVPQRLSDAIRFIMSNMGYDVINYIDDVIGFGTISTADPSYQTLMNLLQRLGLDISVKKLAKIKCALNGWVDRNVAKSSSSHCWALCCTYQNVFTVLVFS